MLGGAADGRPAIDTDAKMAEAILTFSGTTNGELAVQGFRTLEQRTGVHLADLAEGSEEKRITFAQTQQAPVPVITSPEWSGSETGGRRYAPFTVNVERLKPWHTLTGRMHFFLDHDWMRDLGEALPTYRPPLDMHRLFGEPTLGPDGAKQVTVRYLTPHSKWSIHSEYQDNLFMLSLSRGGPTIWLSPQDAAAIGVADNDWMECVNANGVLVGRAIVSHRMPEGVVYVHHAQERTIDVPKSEATGRRGGIHNSVTRLLVKPTHLIGGYAQLSYTFNYLGPTGNQRDMSPPSGVAPRRCSTDARDGPDGHGDEPRQVHRLPHLFGDLQAGVDQPRRHRVRLVQQCRDPAGPGLPAPLRGSGDLAGRLDAEQPRPAQAQGRWPGQEAAGDLRLPGAAQARRLLRAVDLRLSRR